MTKYRVTISRDDQPDNPRDWGNPGTLVLFHRRYRLGDEGHGFDSPEELMDYLENSGEVGLSMEVFGYDHGGLTISTAPFSCPWDSGKLGHIYLTNSEMEKEFKGDLEAARKYLIAQIATYDQYLRGDVYYISIERVLHCAKCGHELLYDVGSCGGIYCDDPEEEYAEILGFSPEDGDSVEVVHAQ